MGIRIQLGINRQDTIVTMKGAAAPVATKVEYVYQLSRASKPRTNYEIP